MEQRNPYEPPQARLQDVVETQADLKESELEYAGFWRRFGAYWIDALVFLPVSVATGYLATTSRLFYLYWFVPGIILGLFFHVYLVRRFGGTPGKVFLKTRIALVDGSRVTVKAATLRYIVLLVLSTLASLAIIMASLKMSDETYLSLSFFARSAELVKLAPSWNIVVTVLLQIWIWGEFLSMMFNKKRRAIHDFIAGTVVIRT